MCVGSPTAGAWSSFQRRPDDEFETDSIVPGTLVVQNWFEELTRLVPTN